jgi:hypothetical protein
VIARQEPIEFWGVLPQFPENIQWVNDVLENPALSMASIEEAWKSIPEFKEVLSRSQIGSRPQWWCIGVFNFQNQIVVLGIPKIEFKRLVFSAGFYVFGDAEKIDLEEFSDELAHHLMSVG